MILCGLYVRLIEHGLKTLCAVGQEVTQPPASACVPDRSRITWAAASSASATASKSASAPTNRATCSASGRPPPRPRISVALSCRSQASAESRSSGRGAAAAAARAAASRSPIASVACSAARIAAAAASACAAAAAATEPTRVVVVSGDGHRLPGGPPRRVNAWLRRRRRWRRRPVARIAAARVAVARFGDRPKIALLLTRRARRPLPLDRVDRVGVRRQELQHRRPANFQLLVCWLPRVEIGVQMIDRVLKQLLALVGVLAGRLRCERRQHLRLLRLAPAERRETGVERGGAGGVEHDR